MNKTDTVKLALSKCLSRFKPSQAPAHDKTYPVDATVTIRGHLQVGSPSFRKPSLDPWALLAVLLDQVLDALETLRTALQEAPPSPEAVRLAKTTLQATIAAPGDPRPIAPRVSFQGLLEVFEEVTK